MSLVMHVNPMTAACSFADTKLAALQRDLTKLQATDSTFHAVVFTHHYRTHEKVVAIVNKLKIKVCSVAGTVKMAERHQAIRDFQVNTLTLQTTILYRLNNID